MAEYDDVHKEKLEAARNLVYTENMSLLLIYWPIAILMLIGNFTFEAIIITILTQTPLLAGVISTKTNKPIWLKIYFILSIVCAAIDLYFLYKLIVALVEFEIFYNTSELCEDDENCLLVAMIFTIIWGIYVMVCLWILAICCIRIAHANEYKKLLQKTEIIRKQYDTIN
ncbi:unnamed protein product [Blepharisma stoltei]|uniref:Uncharacterized protein n=1 Tax=Blepharisma stoltei TaxID=1481888 RepID=A0AAU9JTB3_9CILI|nr:unnamed protein product [Blepharisma stoltei]